MRPKLGVVAHQPIQYHSPLYQRLAQRGNVDLDVLYLCDKGYRSALDPEFGVPVAWDIDLLSGHAHQFMTVGEQAASRARRLRTLLGWVPSHDAVVVNGYNSPWMLATMAICRSSGTPYLLRSSAHPRGVSTGARRYLRYAGAQVVVSASSAGISMGVLNDAFYRQHHARRVIFAPNSVDEERFARPPSLRRADLLAKWNLNADRPVIMYCGKLYPGKRPFDLIAAVSLLPTDVNTIFVGDGMLAEQIRGALPPGRGVVTGFINQSDLPAYYHAADVLVLPSEVETWGLVINEGMAAGAVPVVSHRVGCAPDLVAGVGEVFPCGDVPRLAAALSHALRQVTQDPRIRDTMREHAARYRVELTAEGFEEAAFAVSKSRRSQARGSRPSREPRS